ncbi:MAG: ATP-dependent zinc metalloprotease FtsH [Deltaproteobacteria bacterium]|nr:ATP-dependent zinc metalloprotease FtsH [Deltaproteobacteria bacterium]
MENIKNSSNPDGNPSPGQNPQKFPAINWRRLLWIMFIWLMISYAIGLFSSDGSRNIPYSRFKLNVSADNVEEITVKGHEVRGTFKEPVKGEKIENIFGNERIEEYKKFKTVIPVFEDESLIKLLENKDVVINTRSGGTSLFWSLVITILPWVLIIGFFVYSSRRFQQSMGSGGGLFGFGKSKARLYTKTSSDVTLGDVAGLTNVKKEFAEIIEFLKEPEKFRNLGGELPRGILLVGPPGVGKTLTARAIAGEAGVPFYSISGSEFIEMFVGVGASRVRDMFKNAKKDSPAIIFIDELDSIGRVRGTGLGGGHDEREQTLNQILSEMDGFSPSESLIVLAATNRPDVLDPALIRPGRFDRQITLELPQKKSRKDILMVHTKKIPLADDVDFDEIAGRTVGFSGADLKNLVNEAALLAAREEKEKVDNSDFDMAKDKIIMGIEREDIIQEDEKKLVACHEAGHALVAKLIPGADPLEKVSIIPRGRSLGATEQIPEEDRHNMSRKYLINRISIMLGGRAAEKICFNDVTTGAGDDLKKATQLARRMVCQWGMSDKLGPVTFQTGEPHPFLGREMTEPKEFSEQTARIIDEEISSIIGEAEKKAKEILSSHRRQLDAISSALLEQESLSRKEIEEVLDQAEQEPDKNKKISYG